MRPASILITDDESGIRLMLRTALESEGYDIREAANGHEALDAINGRTPDLMVLDLNMPKLDGIAVLEEMRHLAEGRKPRVVVLTAYGSIPTAVKATRLGAADFLEKPTTPDDLRQTVRGVLDEPGSHGSRLPADDADVYDRALDRVRRSLRTADYAGAEALLTKAAEQNERSRVEYFNLLGVLYEVRRNWRLARKCYGKAIFADKTYQPAQSNMRRIYELDTFGRSTQPLMLGTEPQDIFRFAVR